MLRNLATAALIVLLVPHALAESPRGGTPSCADDALPFAVGPANRLTGARLLQAVSGKKLTYLRKSIRTPGAWVISSREHRADGSMLYICEYGPSQTGPWRPCGSFGSIERRTAGNRTLGCERRPLLYTICVRSSGRGLLRDTSARCNLRSEPRLGPACRMRARHDYVSLARAIVMPEKPPERPVKLVTQLHAGAPALASSEARERRPAERRQAQEDCFFDALRFEPQSLMLTTLRTQLANCECAASIVGRFYSVARADVRGAEGGMQRIEGNRLVGEYRSLERPATAE